MTLRSPSEELTAAIETFEVFSIESEVTSAPPFSSCLESCCPLQEIQIAANESKLAAIELLKIIVLLENGFIVESCFTE